MGKYIVHGPADATEKEIIAAAVAVEAARKVPSGSKVTYFGEDDEWTYHVTNDKRLCDQCKYWFRIKHFRGVHLRAKFPFLEIDGENRIAVHVHDHCRCWLSRKISGLEFAVS